MDRPYRQMSLPRNLLAAATASSAESWKGASQRRVCSAPSPEGTDPVLDLIHADFAQMRLRSRTKSESICR